MQYSVGAKSSWTEDDGDFIDGSFCHCVGHKPMGLISTSLGNGCFLYLYQNGHKKLALLPTVFIPTLLCLSLSANNFACF